MEEQVMRNALICQGMWEDMMAERGYKVKSTFVADLTLVEPYGENAVKEMVNNIIEDWGDNVEYFTEFVLALYAKFLQYLDKDSNLGELYNGLLAVADKHARKVFMGEDLGYYLSQIN